MNREEALKELGFDDIEPSPELLKTQYRALAQLHHPDKGGDTARFQRIKAAYEFLTGKEQPDNSHAKMLERIQGLFLAAVDSCPDPTRYDVLKQIKLGVREVERSLRQHIAQTAASIRKREQVLKRLRSPQDNNFLKSVLEADIARHKASLKELEGELPKCAETLAFIEKYGYEMDEEDQPSIKEIGSPRFLSYRYPD